MRPLSALFRSLNRGDAESAELVLDKSVDTRRTRRATEENHIAVILSAAKDLALAHQSQILR